MQATGQQSSTRKRETESQSERSKTKFKETFFVGRTTLKFFFISGEKLRNPSDLQGENERQRKKKKTWTRTRTTVPP